MAKHTIDECRRELQKHHPDRGGDAAQFQLWRERLDRAREEGQPFGEMADKELAALIATLEKRLLSGLEDANVIDAERVVQHVRRDLGRVLVSAHSRAKAGYLW